MQAQLLFHDSFNGRAAFEMTQRGYLDGCRVSYNGRLFPVFFVDQTRLGQEFDRNKRNGLPFFTEPGLVVVEEVTLDNLLKTVEALAGEGYFDELQRELPPKRWTLS